MKEQVVKESSKKSHALGILLILIGISTIAYSSYKNLNYWKKSFTYDTIEAKVTGHKYDNKGYAAIIVEYQVGEKIYSIEDTSYKKNPIHKQSIINVKYKPENPADVIIDKDKENLAPATLGLLLIIGGIIFNIIVSKYNKYKTNNTNSKQVAETKPEKNENTSNDLLQETQPIKPAATNEQPLETFSDSSTPKIAEELEVFDI